MGMLSPSAKLDTLQGCLEAEGDTHAALKTINLHSSGDRQEASGQQQTFSVLLYSH